MYATFLSDNPVGEVRILVAWVGCRFDGAVDFNRATFAGKVEFDASRFMDAVTFDNVAFGVAGQSRPTLSLETWPDAAKQKYQALKVSPASETGPDFKTTRFDIPPNLGFTTVAVPVAPYGRWWQMGRNLRAIFARESQTEDRNAASKLRRLEELAEAGHHHLAEKRFFPAELLCRRGHEAVTWPEVTMINLFELFSKCGLSFWRPFGWWLFTFAVFWLVYGLTAGIFQAGITADEVFHLINYTFSNATPVLGVIKMGDTAAVAALFGGTQPPWVTLLAGAHNLVSTVFLFFALLAVRNYFKLG